MSKRVFSGLKSRIVWAKQAGREEDYEEENF
jgi:hypothetical protein